MDQDLFTKKIGDGALIGIIRVAKAKPDEPWPAPVVAWLAEQLQEARK